MPMTWIEPAVAFSHRGVEIYHSYKGSDALEYWYSTDVSEDEEYDFDVRNLPVPAGVSPDNHALIVAYAIDNGLLDFVEDPELDPIEVELKVNAEGVEPIVVDACALLDAFPLGQLCDLARADWKSSTVGREHIEGLRSQNYQVAAFLASVAGEKEICIQLDEHQVLTYLKGRRTDAFWTLQCALGRAVPVSGFVDKDLTIRKEVRTFVELTDEQRQAFVEFDEVGYPQLDYLGLCADSGLIAKMHETVRDTAYERTISDAEHGWDLLLTNDVRIEAEIA